MTINRTPGMAQPGGPTPIVQSQPKSREGNTYLGGAVRIVAFNPIVKVGVGGLMGIVGGYKSGEILGPVLYNALYDYASGQGMGAVAALPMGYGIAAGLGAIVAFQLGVTGVNYTRDGVLYLVDSAVDLTWYLGECTASAAWVAAKLPFKAVHLVACELLNV